MSILWIIKVVICVNLLKSFALCDTKKMKYSDVGLTVKELIEKYGYPFENHTVVTPDGYILELHRISSGRNNIQYKRPPILLVHGLMSNAAIWVNTGPQKSLGFILADEGYDVWLGNCRGSTWSRRHIKYDPKKDKKQYWNFSFQEVGYYDLPEFIDYILRATNQEKLFYIGHSQGTTSFFAMGAQKPEYTEKVNLFVALSPVAYLKHSTSPMVKFFALFKDLVENYITQNQFYEVDNYIKFLSALAQRFYLNESPLQDAFVSVLNLVMGDSTNELTKQMLPVITSNALCGGSVKQLHHYLQLYLSGNFQNFNYGEKGNLQHYGQSTPPLYDLHKVGCPVAAYYGTKDVFCAEKDVNRTISELPNVLTLKSFEGYNHVDVILGAEATKLIFNDFIGLLNKY